MRHLHDFLHLVEGFIYLAATILALAGWEAAWLCHLLLGLMHLGASIRPEAISRAVRLCTAALA